MQYYYLAADHSVGEFLGWLPQKMPPAPHPYTCLFDYIEAWLEHGTAVEDCCEDFPTFLTAVTLIVAEWHKGFEPAEDYPQLCALNTVLDQEHTSYSVLDPARFMIARQALDAERWRKLDR